MVLVILVRLFMKINISSILPELKSIKIFLVFSSFGSDEDSIAKAFAIGFGIILSSSNPAFSTQLFNSVFSNTPN